MHATCVNIHESVYVHINADDQSTSRQYTATKSIHTLDLLGHKVMSQVIPVPLIVWSGPSTID